MRTTVMWLTLPLTLASACLGADAEFGVLIRLGLKDKDATDWSGSIAATGGEVSRLEGWRLPSPGRVLPPLGWKAATRDPGGPKNARGRRIEPVGVLAYGRGTDATRLTVVTPRGKLEFTLGQLRSGARGRGLNGQASAERVPVAARLSDSDREDDRPSACVGADGAFWCVWQSYENQSEQLYAACRSNGKWAKPQAIPGAKGDIYKSACAWVGDRLWVVWAQFQDGDFDLKAASFNGVKWTAPQYLTRAKGPDIEPAMTAQGDTGYLVWQASRGSHSDIWLRTVRRGQWHDAQPVTSEPGNDWMPAVTVGPTGVVTVAWDTYRNGNYDIYLRQWVKGKAGAETPVAASEFFEAYATVAADRAGRVWIAYEEGTENWGKDQGAVVPRPHPGTRLYAKRVTRVRVMEGGRLYALEKPPETIVPAGARRFHEKPRLTVDGQGRVWLALRWPTTVRRYLRSRGHFRGYRSWEAYVTTFDGGQWLAATYLPHSICRQDSHAIPCGLPAGGVAMVWHTDSRSMKDVRNPLKNHIYAASLPGAGPPAKPKLVAVEAPAPLKPAPKERADIARIRRRRAVIAGKQHRILRGDLHRHTEVSWDGSGDGTMVDVYRYGIDAGGLDFLEITDHNQRTGPDLEYVWWRTQQLADALHNPPHFITLFGYERSLSFPNGHRNVISAVRGHRTFPNTRNPAGGRGVAPDDAKQLYAYARKTHSVIISHTSGTRMGTDWRDNDPALEPVVEIYQGARTSYEYEGAPKSASPGDRHARGSGYQPQGFVWRAWEKGLRLGIIASSDHGSTHISYASVYAAAPTREAVVQSLRKRHTFGATDNIILELRSGEHFMGDEFAQAEPPALKVLAIGTGPIQELALIKDLRFVYTDNPGRTQVELDWQDRDFGPGTHLYYVRVHQSDGQIAWSSPLWISKK